MFSSIALVTTSNISSIQPFNPVLDSLKILMVSGVNDKASQSSLVARDLSFSALARPFSSSSILDFKGLIEDFLSGSLVDDLQDPLLVFSGTNSIGFGSAPRREVDSQPISP